LAKAMPGACRALGESADAPPDRPAAAVLYDFLAALVDALVRSAAAGGTVAAPVRPAPTKAPAFDSLPDPWLHALPAPEGVLRAPANELAQLAEQVGTWQRPAAVSAAAPFRLCFRLEEPPDGEAGDEVAPPDDGWSVRYLLQARDDPSLLVDVDDAWSPRGP